MFASPEITSSVSIVRQHVSHLEDKFISLVVFPCDLMQFVNHDKSPAVWQEGEQNECNIVVSLYLVTMKTSGADSYMDEIKCWQ